LRAFTRPPMFEPVYEGGEAGKEVRALDPERPKVKRRVVADMNACPPPMDPVVPLVKPVHDRLGVEIARGCTRGCRFCQAGLHLPPGARARSADRAGGGPGRAGPKRA
jgi:radical SAM superfamily enzyme YgiQ (UPF0313 family)